MREESLYFVKVKDVATREVRTCALSESAAQAAATMAEANVSGLVVCDLGSPLGMITDRDLRNKVVARGGDARALPVSAIMGQPLIFVDEDDFLIAALYKMSKHGVHRLPVLDESGRLRGILTTSDINRLQTGPPRDLLLGVENARTPEDLKLLNKRLAGLIVDLTRRKMKTHDIVRLLSYLNSRILMRLIDVLKSRGFSDLTGAFSFVVLGSEGRGEQTLKTDQDNAIVFADDLEGDQVSKLEAFSRELIDALVFIGVPSCPGGIMASAPSWRRGLADWVTTIERWISCPTPENILHCSMLSDLRTVYGDRRLGEALKQHITRRTRGNQVFAAHMAKDVARFPPPLGLFGRLRLERSGANRGKIDIKKAGILAISEGVKLLSLEQGLLGGSTWERIQRLSEDGILSRQEAANLAQAYGLFVYLRLRSQVEELRAGAEPSNWVDPGGLGFIERRRLVDGLSAVRSFQEYLKLRYRLHFVAD